MNLVDIFESMASPEARGDVDPDQAAVLQAREEHAGLTRKLAQARVEAEMLAAQPTQSSARDEIERLSSEFAGPARAGQTGRGRGGPGAGRHRPPGARRRGHAAARRGPRASSERALAIAERVLGPDHPPEQPAQCHHKRRRAGRPSAGYRRY